MKWIFATLVALNLIVFAGFVGNKIMNPKKPQPQVVQAPQQPQAPQQIIINTGNGTPTTVSTNGTVTTNGVPAGLHRRGRIAGRRLPPHQRLAGQIPARGIAPSGAGRRRGRQPNFCPHEYYVYVGEQRRGGRVAKHCGALWRVEPHGLRPLISNDRQPEKQNKRFQAAFGLFNLFN